jgi:hypothetical protein
MDWVTIASPSAIFPFLLSETGLVLLHRVFVFISYEKGSAMSEQTESPNLG